MEFLSCEESIFSFKLSIGESPIGVSPIGVTPIWVSPIGVFPIGVSPIRASPIVGSLRALDFVPSSLIPVLGGILYIAQKCLTF